MSPQPGFTFKLRTAQVKAEVEAATLKAVQEVFELDIKPEAAKGTPVLTGTNRRSIDTETTQTPTGVQAQIFTQSGYGGYLEVGTKKMEARPYILPAFNKFRSKLFDLLRGNIGQQK